MTIPVSTHEHQGHSTLGRSSDCATLVTHEMTTSRTQAPLIAIVGSYDPSSPRYDPRLAHDETKAHRACEELGDQLARAGYRIIVYSAAPTYIETHVVRGYVASGKACERSIEIHAPYARVNPRVRFPEQQDHESLFFEKTNTHEHWQVSFYSSLVHADGVLLLGGASSCLITAMWAFNRKLPILVVSMFGGTAKEVWRIAAGRIGDEVHRLMGEDAWQDDSAARLVKSLDEQFELKKAEAKRIEAAADEQAGRDAVRLKARTTAERASATLLIIATASMITGLSESVPRDVFLALLGVVIVTGGATGGIARLLRPQTTLSHTHSPLGAGVFGALAGVIAAGLFVFSRWATDSHLTLAGLDTMDLQFRLILFFALVVAIVAGLTFDRVFDKLEHVDVDVDVIGAGD